MSQNQTMQFTYYYYPADAAEVNINSSTP